MTIAEDATILSGGVVFDAGWLRCVVTASRRPDELIVKIPNIPGAVAPPTFFVDPSIVRPKTKPMVGVDVDATVKVLLLETREQEAVVEVPGEPVSYGPKLLVPLDLLN